MYIKQNFKNTYIHPYVETIRNTLIQHKPTIPIGEVARKQQNKTGPKRYFSAIHQYLVGELDIGI